VEYIAGAALYYSKCKAQGLKVIGLRKAQLVQLLHSGTTAGKVKSVDTNDDKGAIVTVLMLAVTVMMTSLPMTILMMRRVGVIMRSIPNHPV